MLIFFCLACNSTSTDFLFCFLMKTICYSGFLFRFSEAEVILAGNILNKLKSHEEIETEFGSLSSHVFSLLGAIYSKTERPQKAVDCYKKSLKLNPLLWSAYERLCQLGKILIFSSYHSSR